MAAPGTEDSFPASLNGENNPYRYAGNPSGHFIWFLTPALDHLFVSVE